jgi:hypothetical protein
MPATPDTIPTNGTGTNGHATAHHLELADPRRYSPAQLASALRSWAKFLRDQGTPIGNPLDHHRADLLEAAAAAAEGHPWCEPTVGCALARTGEDGRPRYLAAARLPQVVESAHVGDAAIFPELGEARAWYGKLPEETRRELARHGYHYEAVRVETLGALESLPQVERATGPAFAVRHTDPSGRVRFVGSLEDDERTVREDWARRFPTRKAAAAWLEKARRWLREGDYEVVEIGGAGAEGPA